MPLEHINNIDDCGAEHCLISFFVDDRAIIDSIVNGERTLITAHDTHPLMKVLKRTLLAIALPALGLIHTADAHRQWMIASTTVLSGEDQWITVEAAISNDLFFPNHVPIPLDRTHAISPSGKQLELHSATEGKIRTSFELNLKEQGTYRISYVNSVMFSSWEEEGETQYYRGYREDIEAKGITEKEGFKAGEYDSRVEAIVTCGAPTPLQTIGSGLEFSFVTHPNDLFVGETARFQTILNGEPKANCEVTVVKGNDRYRDTVDEQVVTSDADGFIEIAWPTAGRYWLNAYEEIEPGEIDGKPVKRGTTYTLTLEVLPE